MCFLFRTQWERKLTSRRECGKLAEPLDLVIKINTILTRLQIENVQRVTSNRLILQGDLSVISTFIKRTHLFLISTTHALALIFFLFFLGESGVHDAGRDGPLLCSHSLYSRVYSDAAGPWRLWDQRQELTHQRISSCQSCETRKPAHCENAARARRQSERSSWAQW